MTAPRREKTDDVLIHALASGISHKRAAEVAGVSESTVERRQRDGAFRDRVEAARLDRIVRTADKLAALSEQALTVLSALLQNVGTSDATRARVALAVVPLAMTARELLVVEQRLAAVEARLAEQSATTPRSAWA